MAVDTETQLAWEKRHRPRAGIAAVLSAIGLILFYIGDQLLRQDVPSASGLESLVRAAQPGPVGELLQAFAREQADVFPKRTEAARVDAQAVALCFCAAADGRTATSPSAGRIFLRKIRPSPGQASDGRGSILAEVR